MVNQYDLEIIKSLAQENEALSSELTFAYDKIKGRLAKSTGKVKEGIDCLIDETNTLTTESRDFLRISAEFISNLGEELQQMDKTMARKIEES